MPQTISESVASYLAAKSSRTPGYIRDLGITFRGLTDSVGDLQMLSLREEHFAKAFDYWMAKDAPGTFNKKLGHIQQWLMHASRRRLLKVSPAELLGSVERRRVIPRRRLYLSASELLSLLEKTTHPRDRAYLALAMNTALRAGEIRSLQIEDVDLAHGSLYVLRHKTATRDILPITKDLDCELRRWLRFYTEKVGVLKDHYVLTPAKDSPVVMGRAVLLSEVARLAVRLKPETQMQPDHEFMHKLLEAAGYPNEREGMHTIRRSVARVSYDYYSQQNETRDEALSIVQATLGHSTQAITEKYIGAERFKEKRDHLMRGGAFLSAMADSPSNVRRLHG